MKRFLLFLLMTISCSLMSYSQDVVGKSKTRIIKLKVKPELWFEKHKNGIFLCIGDCEQPPYKILLKHSDGKVDICDYQTQYVEVVDGYNGSTVKKTSCFNVTKIKISNIVKMRCVYKGERYEDTSEIYYYRTLYDLFHQNVVSYQIGEELSKLQSQAIDEYKKRMAISSGADF